MTSHKSPVVNDAIALMLWYAPIRNAPQPNKMPDQFPCIAVVAQVGIHEGVEYVYPGDFKKPVKPVKKPKPRKVHAKKRRK